MDNKNKFTEENFNVLLSWLDQDREAAGQKYEKIRQRLIRFFIGRGCFEAEELADETFNRVTGKMPEIAGSYVGEPLRYCYGVAAKVLLEWLRERKKLQMLKPPNADSNAAALELQSECLESCLRKLSDEQRQLIVEYYREEKNTKIENRRKLAEKHAITSNALQVKASRIRNQLKICLHDCVMEKTRRERFW